MDTSADSSDMRSRILGIERKKTASAAWEPLRYYAKNCSEVTVAGVTSVGTGPAPNPLTPVCMQKYFAGDTCLKQGTSGHRR